MTKAKASTTPNQGILYHSAHLQFNLNIEGVIANVKSLVTTEPNAPWEFWLAVWRAIAGREHRFKVIQNRRKGYAGFVVAHWNQTGKLKTFLESSGKRFVPFQTQIILNSPWMVSTLDSVFLRVIEIRSRIQQVGMIPWCDDRCNDVPMEDYLQIGTGEKKPWSRKPTWG